MRKAAPANSKLADKSGQNSPTSEPDRLHQPTGREVAMLALHLLQAKKQEVHREVTRARLTEITMRRLSGRTRITQDLLEEVQELLLQAGWVLFWAKSSYAVIQVSAVEGWARISSKRIDEDLKMVKRGKFNFDALEPLLIVQEKSSLGGDDDEASAQGSD